MSLLQSTGPELVGAVALLQHADPAECARFTALEDAVWSNTTLRPAVIESVRLRCAHLRRCESCSAMRISAGTEDGLTESQIPLLDKPDARDELTPGQTAALTLVDRFFHNPRAPGEAESTRIAEVLGSRGVLEVLITCAVFCSSELRRALGEDGAPESNVIVERPCGTVEEQDSATRWPALETSLLDPEGRFPEAAPELTEPVHDLVRTLWSGAGCLSPDVAAACVIRSTQLFGIESDEPVIALLVPAIAADLANSDDVRNWTHWPTGLRRDVLELAETLWLDPSQVDETVTDPLTAAIGVEGVILATWELLWIKQLHRLTLVLHRGR
ncbi:MAG: hypothetical protein OXJ56_02580 [Rhodospirillaceae bacterium]|nr:hypothetical protein [Rhodospirillaceae bacterium]MDE0363574.1 hypothetical protein [Rhodospirillaceae bacterium]